MHESLESLVVSASSACAFETTLREVRLVMEPHGIPSRGPGEFGLTKAAPAMGDLGPRQHSVPALPPLAGSAQLTGPSRGRVAEVA